MRRDCLVSSPGDRRPTRSAAQGAEVAQLVEHITENDGVGGSIPPLGTNSLPEAERF